MATSFEPSLSASAMRNHLASDPPSMADTLPTVNFGFEELRDRMAKFTARFDDFIEKGRARVLSERNAFRMNIAELQDDAQHLDLSLQSTQHAQQMHSQALIKERAETADLHAAIDTLTTHRSTLINQKTMLQTDLGSLQSTLYARKEAQAAHARYIADQSRYNGPELAFWEERLGLRIQLGECTNKEGGGGTIPSKEDQIRFSFAHVSDTNWAREAWVELDVSQRDYRVVATEPKLEKGDVQAAVDGLNEGRDLVPFLVEIRGLLVGGLK